MSTEEDWPKELLWRPDGHLSDEATVALADAQWLGLPQAVLSHLDDCEECASRVCAMADHSVALQDWFAAAEHGVDEAVVMPLAAIIAIAASAPVPPPRAYPWAAMAAAVVVAALGLVPTIWMSGGRAVRNGYAAIKAAPALAETALEVVRAGRASFGVGLLSLLPAVAFVLLALIIARRAMRQLPEGEVHA